MTIAGYLNTTKKLEEGKNYLFRVHDLVMLQDERVYFILEDPYGIRHLMPSWFYTRYKIEKGQMINCIVDKINCTGRIYLEPEHPAYSIGGIYEFKLCAVHTNEQRRKTKLILTDIFANEIEVNCPAELVLSIGGSAFVECIVVRIRKGKPVLALSKDFMKKMQLSLTSHQTESVD